MTAILYIWTACMSLLTSTEFSWIWMEGKRSKMGVWKYTLPCIQWACATFPGCNWHGGYDLIFLTIRLDRTLEMMQNDVKTSEFGYRSMEIWLFLDDAV